MTWKIPDNFRGTVTKLTEYDKFGIRVFLNPGGIDGTLFDILLRVHPANEENYEEIY